MIRMGFLFGSLLILFHIGNVAMAVNPEGKSKTTTILIPTDQLPPPSAEEVVPMTPFFSGSTGNEAMDYIQALEERVSKLERQISQSAEHNVTIKSEGTLSIESKGDIEINTPGVIKMKAKAVEMPSKEE